MPVFKHNAMVAAPVCRPLRLQYRRDGKAKIAENGLYDAAQPLKVGRGMTVSEIAPMGQAIGVERETTAAFIGRALQGPLNMPILVESFAAFQRRFGGTWHRSSLGPAVQQFFDHGGRRVYIVRVANNARGAMICLPARQGVLVLRALEPGSTERMRAAVDYDGIAEGDHEHFNLTLQRLAPHTGVIVDQEIHRRLSCEPRARGFIGHALAASDLAAAQAPLPGGRPLPTIDPGNRIDPGYVEHVQPGSDGSSLTDYDLIGSAISGSGLFALNQVEHLDLLYLPPPGRGQDLGPAAILAAELYSRRRSAMLIMDPPGAWQTAAEAVDGIRSAGYASPNTLTYYPRLRDRATGDAPARAAGGALAGLLCRSDRRHGPWQGVDHPDLAFRPGLAPAAEVSDAESAMLVREGVNVVVAAPNRRSILRGSVTLARNSQLDRQFGRLGSRRLCLMITDAIERATRWAVFETNDPQVGERVEAQVHAYLSGLADAGAFASDQFRVRCEIARPADERSDPCPGMTIMLEFRPVGADQAVSLTLQQTVSGCRVGSTAFAAVRGA